MTRNGYTLAEVDEYTWRIGTLFDGRNVYQYLLRSQQGPTLLIDAGTGITPREAILPALRDLGIARAAVEAVIVTHPDVDHQGGLAELKCALPNAATVCGFADLGLVSDPERLVSERYGAYEHAHGIGLDDSEKRSIRSLYGAKVWIDLPLAGGEQLRLGERLVHFVHAPGHSAGHLIVHEPRTGALFTSDALHGRAIPGADGSPALPPTYEDVDAYLTTLERVRALEPSTLHSGHWPPQAGRSIVDWLKECAEFVIDTDAAIHERLTSPATLRDLCEYVESRMGPFGSASDALVFVAHGHLRRLLRRGVATAVDLREIPPRFRLTGNDEEATTHEQRP